MGLWLFDTFFFCPFYTVYKGKHACAANTKMDKKKERQVRQKMGFGEKKTVTENTVTKKVAEKFKRKSSPLLKY